MIKTSFLFLVLVSLLSCSLDKNIHTKKTLNKLPYKWDIDGQIAIKANNEYKSGSFNWRQEYDDFNFTLTAPLALSSFEIRKNDSNLYVNNKAINLNFKDWMLKEYGWFLPTKHLAKVIFLTNGKLENEWNVKYITYKIIQGFKVAKKITLTNLKKNIELKLNIYNLKFK